MPSFETTTRPADVELRHSADLAGEIGDALAMLGLDAVELLGGDVSLEVARELRRSLADLGRSVGIIRTRFRRRAGLKT